MAFRTDVNKHKKKKIPSKKDFQELLKLTEEILEALEKLRRNQSALRKKYKRLCEYTEQE